MTRYKGRRRASALFVHRKDAMVNETFLLSFNWEIFAGPTWSTRGYCRGLASLRNRQASV